jgi:hypothetical protein
VTPAADPVVPVAKPLLLLLRLSVGVSEVLQANRAVTVRQARLDEDKLVFLLGGYRQCPFELFLRGGLEAKGV